MHLFDIPQCFIQNRNVHIFVLNGALWNIEQAHSGICEIGLFDFGICLFHRIHACSFIRQNICFGRNGCKHISCNNFIPTSKWAWNTEWTLNKKCSLFLFNYIFISKWVKRIWYVHLFCRLLTSKLRFYSLIKFSDNHGAIHMPISSLSNIKKMLRGSINSKSDFIYMFCHLFAQITLILHNILLPHQGRVAHICVNKLTSFGSDNSLSPNWHQSIIWTNGELLLTRTFGTNVSENLSEIHTFSFKKIHLKMSSGKWRPFCVGLNVF